MTAVTGWGAVARRPQIITSSARVLVPVGAPQKPPHPMIDARDADQRHAAGQIQDCARPPSGARSQGGRLDRALAVRRAPLKVR